ncbi:MAG: hypothetical protein QM734_16950 [Cyclobacteriaceae bacterium]
MLTLILDENNKIYWRQGISIPKLETIESTNESIHKLLVTKNKEIDEMLVLVKSTSKSKYKNLVDVLDELEIAKIRYCFDDLTKDELQLIEIVKNRPLTSK